MVAEATNWSKPAENFERTEAVRWRANEWMTKKTISRRQWRHSTTRIMHLRHMKDYTISKFTHDLSVASLGIHRRNDTLLSSRSITQHQQPLFRFLMCRRSWNSVIVIKLSVKTVVMYARHRACSTAHLRFIQSATRPPFQTACFDFCLSPYPVGYHRGRSRSMQACAV
jgi:hypothetical protein